MGTDTTMIALDSSTVTYFIQAMNSFDSAPSNPFAEEKLALARLFFYLPRSSSLRTTPTVEDEIGAIRERTKLDDHLSWLLSHLSPVRPLPEKLKLDARVKELLAYHTGEKDCRIVAESEQTDIDVLLVCEPKFLAHLRDKVSGVRLLRPSEYWDELGIARGATPTWKPSPGNPLEQCSWWRW